MKKHFILFFILVLNCFTNINAQFETSGTHNYGRLFDITYDLTVEDKLYASTLKNHLLVSHDKGENWEILFSFPITEAIEIHDLKQIGENTLSFIMYNLDSNNNKLVFYDMETNELTKEIYPPFEADFNRIKSYSVYGPNPDVILLHASFDWENVEKIFYTTDGGENWSEVYDHAENNGVTVNNAVISPFDPDKLFLARGVGNFDEDGGFWVSENAGADWTEVISRATFDAIEFNAMNPQDILVGTSMNFNEQTENIFRSSDGGNTWTEISIPWTDGVLNHINIIKFNPFNFDNIIVLEENEVVISQDRGNNWETYPYTNDNPFEYYAGLNMSFNPFVEDELIITGNFYPFYSNDGAVTLSQLRNPYFEVTGSLDLFSKDTEHLYYGVQCGYVHLNLTTMEEQSMEIPPIGSYSVSSADKIFADQNVEGRVYNFKGGFMGAEVTLSEDHGLTKIPLMSTFMNYLDAAVSDPNDSNMIWVAVSDIVTENELYKIDISNPENITSTLMNLPQNGTMSGLYFNTTDSEEMIAAIGAGIFKSTDGASTWTPWGSGLEMYLDPSIDVILKFSQNPANPDIFSIATSQGIFVSTDAGENWTKKYDGIIQNVSLSSFDLNHIVGVVQTSEFTSPKIIFSTDLGESWEEITSEELFDVATYKSTVRFTEDSAEIYLGTFDLGLIKITVDLETLNVSEPEFITSKIIYPNPTRDFINIQSHEEINSVEIYSLSGQKLMTSSANKIDVSHLNKGVYIIKIELKNGKIESQKFIKN